MIVHSVKPGHQNSAHKKERAHKRIYVSSCLDDNRYKEMLVNGKHRWELYSQPTIDFVTIERQTIELVNYRETAEQIIAAFDGVMIIVSEQTSDDPVILWEIEFVKAQSIPVIGVDVSPQGDGDVAQKLQIKLTKFGWEWFATFINRL
ncbi:MAG: hypothetical protein D6B25_01110 [Desulfobulbaceae bacterium]|nr:MAG: hypothetical protein D6B25_01110 [Desulfobulbaceae bacterium]